MSLRKKLYEYTRDQHVAVENIFNLEKTITEEKLLLFYQTILVTRLNFRECLAELEKKLSVKTDNNQLIKMLGKDLNIDPKSLPLEEKQFKNLSYAIGVFYVFAGSSAGARQILKLAKQKQPELKFYYFNFLEDLSGMQLKHLKLLLENEDLDETSVLEAAKEVFNEILKVGKKLS